jgi:uncharacterized protein YbjT (DUF2867 family)
MNVTVFGATGGIGREVVTQALDAGHHVTAYLRNPAKLPGPTPTSRRSPASSPTATRSSAPWTAPTPSSARSARH